MPSQSDVVGVAGGLDPQAATNQRIVELLEELKSELADSKKLQQQIARDLARLLQRK